MAKSFHTNLTHPNSLTGTLHAEVFLCNDDNDTNGNEVQHQQDASPVSSNATSFGNRG
jgi:hypothetical protein